jgi:hypothetical protein
MCSSGRGSVEIQIVNGPVSAQVWLLPTAWEKQAHTLHVKFVTTKTISYATVVSRSPKEALNMANIPSWITNQSCMVFEDTWLLKILAQLLHGSSVVTSTKSSFWPWIYPRRKVPFVNAQPLTG